MLEDFQAPPEGLYGPRAGEYVDYYANILHSAPDRELSPEQLQEFLDFEASLMDGGRTESSIDSEDPRVKGIDMSLNELEDQTSYSQDRAELSLDYFLSNDGQKEILALGLASEPISDTATLAALFRSNATQIPKAALKNLQKTSEKYVDDATANAIAEGKDIGPPERVVVFNDGTKLLLKARGLWAYKKFFRETASILNTQKDESDNLLAAKKAVLNMYRRKVNGFIAQLEPDMLNFWRQLESMEEGNHKRMLQESVSMIWPPIARIDSDQESAAMKRFIVRLDRIRNGVSTKDKARYTAVSQDLEKLFESGGQSRIETAAEPVFSAAEIEALDSIVFDATQMQQFCEQLLDGIDKFSSESDKTYDPDRPTRAADGKWQVPIREDVGAITVDDPPGALAIPASFSRSLTKATPPVGAIPGALHEVKHVCQNDNYRNNQRGMKLGKLMKGKGAIVLREAGALDVERKVQAHLFGRPRPDNPHHLKAIKVLEAGGSEIDADKAFFDSYLQSNPQATRLEAAKAAVRGVKRSARRAGGFNTQALDYAESTLIFMSASNLDEQTRDIIFGEAAFNLEDLSVLHRFGLLKGSNTEPFPMDKLLNFTADYMRKTISENMDKVG